MRKYGRVETGFWRNPKVRRLSEDGRMALLYLCSCPHGNAAGCFILPTPYIAHDLCWSPDRVGETVEELVRFGFIKRDQETDLTLIIGWFGHNTIENRNVAKSILSTIKSLPECEVKQELISALKVLPDLHPTVSETLSELFIKPLRTPEPEPEPSDANASSADAAQLGCGDGDKPVDLKARIFGGAREWLIERGGVTDAKARKVLGQWCRDYGDGATLEALQNAARASPEEPISWITGVLNGTAGKRFGQPFSSVELLGDMADDERSRWAGAADYHDPAYHALPRA